MQDVLKRILGALIFRKDLFAEVEASPDLYGPFWLATTAVFLMAMISNALEWISDGEAWEGDLKKIAYGATILYSYVFGGGFLLWVWLKVISLAQISLTALWCIYGVASAVCCCCCCFWPGMVIPAPQCVHGCTDTGRNASNDLHAESASSLWSPCDKIDNVSIIW